jgi:hypothetical protein
MPVLTAPTAPPPQPELDLPAISFFGRSLDEYVQFFALDLTSLRGAAVLDVAAGPSSFTAEACRLGLDAVAVDPLYGSSHDTLAAQVQLDYARMFSQMRAKSRLFKTGRNRPGTYFSSINEAEVNRRAAAQRFLTDYAAHYAHGRYIGAALPRLPFFDGAFDLVLCAHLLFTYAQRFDFDWHLAACRELVRVSAGEVRLHPICGLGGKRYPELDRLRRELLTRGITSKIVRVNYEFFTGSNATLVLNPREP